MWASIYGPSMQRRWKYLCMYKWWCIISLLPSPRRKRQRDWEKNEKKNSHHADLNDRAWARARIKSTKYSLCRSHRTSSLLIMIRGGCVYVFMYKNIQHSTSRTFCIFVLKIEWFIAVSLMENVLNLYRSVKIRQRQQRRSFIKICSDRTREWERERTDRHWSTEGSCCCDPAFYFILNRRSRRAVVLLLCRLCGHILFLSLLFYQLSYIFFVRSLEFDAIAGLSHLTFNFTPAQSTANIIKYGENHFIFSLSLSRARTHIS